jgi:D-arabinose 1-dehydrogenase-like Zn-dependent alcohol dehydrogenase
VTSQAIVATAAASGLGRQLTRYASACGIDVVAVVRRAEQMQACREEGAVVTLDASADSFDADMKVGVRVEARAAVEG